MAVLVVGGNGQLGAACCDLLARRGVDVRASVRDSSRAAFLRPLGVDVARIDLRSDPQQWIDALRDVDTLILTANSVAPRKGDDPGAAEAGLRRLVKTSMSRAGRRFVLPSLPVTGVDDRVPMVAARRRLERLLASPGVDGRVLRFPPFMDTWLALVGSSLPLRGEPQATIGRPSPFLRSFRRITATSVESRGLMLVPGPADHRHAFISVADAARACVEAALRDDPLPAPVDVAGPEILSWRQVAEAFERVLGRRVRVLSTPTPVYAAAAAVLSRIAEVPARTMTLNRYAGSGQTPWTMPGGGLVDSGTMVTLEAFLRHKAALPATLPVVA